ncbi:MAG: TA system VapC family ribonuclease toxin [Fimbriimonas sp.]
MTALLDVNVLLALLDADHLHHNRAKEWMLSQSNPAWASCPLTQNSFVRIISQPAYPASVSVQNATDLLLEATRSAHHTFWPDDLSILDDAVFDHSRIHGPKQITDAYLLALAVKNDGRLVAFDRSIALSSVRRAQPINIEIL